MMLGSGSWSALLRISQSTVGQAQKEGILGFLLVQGQQVSRLMALVP